MALTADQVIKVLKEDFKDVFPPHFTDFLVQLIKLQTVADGDLTLASPLTGYITGPNTPITATDSILEGFGKLEGQVSARSAANPSGVAGLTAVNGSADTYMRSDGAPAISQAIVPTWTGKHTFTTATDVVQANGNGVAITPAVSGGIPSIAAMGVNPNVSLQISAKGGAGVNVTSPLQADNGLNVTGKVGVGVAPVGMVHIGQGTSAMTSPAGDQGIVMTNNQAYGTRFYMENLLGTSGQRMMMIGNYSNQMVFSSLNDTATAFVHEGIMRLNAGAGTVTMKSMIGTGTRNVVAAADGTLSSQVAPTVFQGATLPSDLTPYADGSFFIIG